MRYILVILFIVVVGDCLSQPVTNRSSDVITVQDGNLFAKNSFRPAVFADTISANNSVTTLDSCGKMIFTYTDNSYWLRACNPKRWIKILKTGDFATTLVNNGLSKSGDTIQLGGTLNKYTFIKIKNQKSNPDITGTNSLMLSNVSQDSSEYSWLIGNDPSTTNYDRGLIQLSKLYGLNDTLTKWYGGVISGHTRAVFSHTTNNRFKNPATPLSLPYGGANMVSQLFPPDTAYWISYPYGNTASAYSGDIGIGDTTDYYLNIIGTTAVPEYPIPVSRMGFDYARNYRYNKRELYGSGTAGYTWDWRSYQANIDAGTTEIGSYINKIYGFHAYGPLWKHDESPSKAKTLAVSTVDSSFAFYAAPVYTDFNEVKNGYGFVADGASDYNFFKGKLKVGGTMQSSTNTQSFRVHIDSTLQVGRTLSTNAWHTNYWLRNNVTPANFSSSPNRGTWIQTEFSFDQNTDIRNSGITALRADMYLHADSVQYVYNSNATGVGVMGANFGLYLRKKVGYVDTTTFIGGATATGAAAAATSRFDMSGPAASGSPNLGTGYFSSFSPNYQFNSFNTLDHAIWMNIGVGQFIGTTNATNGYGVYINGFPSQVTNKYAIYQSGTLDSNLFYGKVRLPNVLAQTDTTLYKPAVFDALGNIHKLTSWPEGVSSVSNSDGSLTISPTTGAVVGSINLAHSNAFTVSQSITSATQLGLQINMSNTVDNTYAVVFNRASSSVENAFNWNTNNTSEWFLGQNNDGTSDIIMFNWTANKFLYKAFISSGDIGFGNALDALYIKNDGSYVTLASLDTDNTAPATTGTTKVVVTDALGKLSFKNVTFDGSDNVTFGTTNSIVGTATNNSAVAGNIGEEVSSTISTYTNYSTTATYQNITSITLTPGDWDLTAFFTYSSNSATITAGANGIFVISTTTASAAGATEGKNIAYVPQAALLGTSLFSDAIAPYRVSISSNTTYYLNTQATFTLGNPQYVGSLRARRMR